MVLLVLLVSPLSFDPLALLPESSFLGAITATAVAGSDFGFSASFGFSVATG